MWRSDNITVVTSGLGTVLQRSLYVVSAAASAGLVPRLPFLTWSISLRAWGRPCLFKMVRSPLPSRSAGMLPCLTARSGTRAFQLSRVPGALLSPGGRERPETPPRAGPAATPARLPPSRSPTYGSQLQGRGRTGSPEPVHTTLRPQVTTF